jgi:hypothetical protein
MFRDILFRLRALVRCSALEQELDEELRAHLEHETRKHVEGGMSPSDAARLARLALCGPEEVKEQAGTCAGRAGSRSSAKSSGTLFGFSDAPFERARRRLHVRDYFKPRFFPAASRPIDSRMRVSRVSARLAV